jgi:hypothetical protein
METLTKYIPECFAGDVMKVVGFMIDDMATIDMLQTQEIKAIIKATLVGIKTKKPTFNERPKPTKAFMKKYNSGNTYTLTESKTESCLGARLSVVKDCYFDMVYHDGINLDQFISLCDSYVDHHIFDGEDVADAA